MVKKEREMREIGRGEREIGGGGEERENKKDGEVKFVPPPFQMSRQYK